MNGLVSIVVDSTPEDYFKAELLMFSLEKFGGVPRNRILVQCVDRVSRDFLEFLQLRGYAYRLVTPFLDGKNCSKLQQLEGIEPYLKDGDGIYLLDTGVAVLAPFTVPDGRAVSGKIVDLPEPPLHVLEKIFASADLGLPEIVSSGCDQGRTLSGNFDGAFLFIPANLIRAVSAEWRNLASWLFQRPQLFDSAQQRIPIDQVALSMALSSLSLDAARLPANFNFSLNQKNRPANFLPEQPIRILHYRRINPFGTIDSDHSDGGVPDKSLAEFNAAVAAQKQFVFFDAYKRQQAESAMQTAAPRRNDALHQMLSSLNLNEQPRRRLILHAGTPKTGTTSLQFYLDENRAMLQSQGILYPSLARISSTAVPKHQWLIDGLLSGNEALLAGKMNAAIRELEPDIHTIILSTEGIFNHWWDFPPASKAWLATLGNWFEVELWVWFREPAAFMKSNYLQRLCNPRTPLVRSNGADLSMEESLQDTWVIRHLDYLGFLREAQAVFGGNGVRAFAYDGSTVGMALKQLGLPAPQHKNEQRRNVSIGEMGVNLIRVVNRYDLNLLEKEQAVELVKQLDAVAAKKCGPFIPDDAAREHIKTGFALQEQILRDEFGLSWTPESDNLPGHPARTPLAQPGLMSSPKFTRFF